LSAIVKETTEKTAPARRSRSAGTNRRFIVSDTPDSWIAHDRDSYNCEFLLFNKLTGTYHAWTSELHIQFPQLARGSFKDPEDCPVDENHLPKADLLMLLALRHRFKEHMPGSEFVARSWRRLALQKRSSELTETTGKTISDGNWKLAMDIADDEFEFEKYAGQWLRWKVQEDRAGDILIRFGKWLNKAAPIESEIIEPHYLRFFGAVETAATDVGGIPTQAAVQAIYEKGLSANQLGAKTGFRSVKDQLVFGWLPAKGRGKAKQQKKSGIKSGR
jgi:hypothetical protein